MKSAPKRKQADSCRTRRGGSRDALTPWFRRRSVLLGDVIEAALDNAAFVTSDPAKQAELAASHLGRILGRLGEARPAGLPSGA